MRSRCSLLLFLLLACRAERGRRDVRDYSPARADTATVFSSVAANEGCRQTSGQGPDTTIRVTDTVRTQAWRASFGRTDPEFECRIHRTLALRLVAVVDSAYPAVDSVRVVATPDSTIQVLRRESHEAEAPMPWHADVLRAIDLDADGWRDVLLGRFWGATGNRGYDVWRYHPATRRFVLDSTLSGLSNPAPAPGRPCVTTWSTTSARDDETGVYCLHDGRWRLDSAESNSWNRDSATVTHEITTRRGDSLVILKRTTRPDSTW